MKRLLLPFLSISLFLSCATSPKIDTFILDDSVQQRFIRSSSLERPGLRADIDFTVRTEKDLITGVVANFTVSGSKEAIATLERAEFLASDGTVLALAVSAILYIDRNANLARYTSTMTPADFNRLIREKAPGLRVVTKSAALDFKPTPGFLTQLRGAETQFVW
jgi:hypothetical protein